MRVLAFLAIIGFVSAAPQDEVDVRGIIEDGINNTITDALAGLPDTLSIDSIPIDFGDTDVVSGGLNASSVTINGIKSLVATEIKLNILSLSLNMNIHIKELLVNFKYWADFLLLKLVPLYGEGRMNIVLEDIDLRISGKAKLSGGLSLSNITVVINLGDATFDLNGLINNPEFSALVSAALNDNFVTFVDKNADVISSIISPIIESIINGALGKSEVLKAMEVDKMVMSQYRRY